MTDYTQTLKGMADAFIVRKSNDLDIDVDDVFASINWERDTENDDYFAKLVKMKVVKSSDITRRRTAARKVARVSDELGINPETPIAYVRAWAEKSDVKVDWKGSMWVAGEFVTIIDLKRTMRMKAVELDLPYDRSDIDDATDQLYLERMAERPAAMNLHFTVRRDFNWHMLARFFVTNDRMSEGLVIAILQKFVHSARRKLAGKKVTYHLMPVIHGPQGCGKTYLIERMVAPVAEATAWSDFGQLTDDRNITLFNSLVIVLDEMSKAAKADSETVKHVITAEMLDRRPMRSNVTIMVPNRATMIGASNHRLDELIRDETGNRRFAELIYNMMVDRDLLDQIDFEAMWSSIQPDDADPLEPFRDELVALQKDSKVAGPVEDWLQTARLASGEYDTGTLYGLFLEHRASVTPTVDFQSRTQNTFASELRRITDQTTEYGISKVHTRRGNRWMVEGFLTVMEGGR